MMDEALVQEIRDVLDRADVWGRLAGRYAHGDAFPRLTHKHLGIECDFSYTALVMLLDALMTERDA